MKNIRKNYMYISITFLLLSIYVIFFPVIAKIMSYISPSLTTCTYKKITGKNCPLCGGTRYIANLGQVLENPSYLISPFGLMILFIIFELIFRIYCIIKIKKTGKEITNSLKKTVIFDIVIHTIVTIIFFAYEIIFIIIN